MANEVIDKEFQKVYQELVQVTQESETSSSELQKLQELWRKCRENENRLSLRCRDLQTQVAAMKARSLATAAKSKEDKATIASLKKELENAWKIVDEAQEKEQKSRDVIQNLQQEVDHLSRTVEHSISLSLTQERLAELQKAKDDLTAEKERYLLEISELEEKVASCEAVIESQTQEKAVLHSQLAQSALDSQNKDANLQQEIRLREKVEIHLRQLQAEADSKHNLIQSMKQQNEDMTIRLDISQNHSKEIEIASEGRKKELDDIKSQSEKLQQENDAYRRQINILSEEKHKADVVMKLHHQSFLKLNGECLKQSKLKDSLILKIQKLGELNSKISEHKSSLKSTVIELEKENAAANKKIYKDEKVIDELLGEKSALRQNIAKLVEYNKNLNSQLESSKHITKRLNQELVLIKAELDKQNKLTEASTKDRDILIVEIKEWQKKNQQLIDEVQSNELLLLDCQRRSSDLQAKIHKQKSEMESLKTKHEICSKSLGESQEELSDFKRKLKEIDHEKEGLKEEVQSQEQQLFQERRRCRNLIKEKDVLTSELQHVKTLFNKWRSRCQAWETNRKMSTEVISQMGRTNSQQKQEIEQYIRSSQRGDSVLAEKESEVQSLRKNVILLKQFSQRNESEQRRLNDDIRLLKLEIKRLKDENQYLRNSVAAFTDLQKEISRLEKELMTEKLKNKGLELELENPHNIHRWRKLAGNDPPVYELLQKNRIIQKRLIFKSEEQSFKTKTTTVFESELDAPKASDPNSELTQLRQIESETAAQLLDIKTQLRCKEKRIKSLTSEQDVNLARIDHFKNETDKLRSELRDAKMQILILKKSTSLQDVSSKVTRSPPAQTKATSALTFNFKMRSFGSGYRIINSSRA